MAHIEGIVLDVIALILQQNLIGKLYYFMLLVYMNEWMVRLKNIIFLMQQEYMLINDNFFISFI